MHVWLQKLAVQSSVSGNSGLTNCFANAVTNLTEVHLQIKPFYMFSLDPCEVTRCRFNSLCQVASVNTTICVCRQEQATIFDPVCGTDGRTYNNVDEMKFENCQKMKTTEIQHPGACGKYSKEKLFLSFFFELHDE